MSTDWVVEVEHLRNYLGGSWVHKDVNLHVKRGEIYAIVGGSGSGKTTILRSILMLQPPTSGKIRVFGQDVIKASNKENRALRKRWGMLFQHGALFSSLTVLENILFLLNEFTELSQEMKHDLAMMKIAFVGLPRDAANKLPSQLSGGMIKRAALARAIALDPELLFLDEPTSGLDPKGAEEFDELIRSLQQTLNLTIIMVTHDLDSLWNVTDRVGFLGEGKMLAELPMPELVKDSNPIIQGYFSGPRGELRTSSKHGKL